MQGLFIGPTSSAACSESCNAVRPLSYGSLTGNLNQRRGYFKALVNSTSRNATFPAVSSSAAAVQLTRCQLQPHLPP